MARGPKNPESSPRAQAPLRPTGAFLLRFLLAWLGALVLFALVPQIERWMVGATIATVRWSGSLFGVSSEVRDGLLYLGGARGVNVVTDCTSLMSTTLLWSGILAYPAGVRLKVLGMATGAAVLWGYNLLRVVFMIAILGWDRSIWNFLHVYVWQTVTIVFACALFLFWLRRAAPRALGT